MGLPALPLPCTHHCQSVCQSVICKLIASGWCARGHHLQPVLRAGSFPGSIFRTYMELVLVCTVLYSMYILYTPEHLHMYVQRALGDRGRVGKAPPL